MSARTRTTAARWILPIYVLAITVGGWFHNHPRPPRMASEACVDCLSCSSLSPAAGDRTEEPGAAHGLSGDRLPAGDLPCDSCPDKTCPVCHFLAHKPAPAEHVEEVTSAPLAEEIAVAPPALVFADVPSVHHSRAPPSVA